MTLNNALFSLKVNCYLQKNTYNREKSLQTCYSEN